MKVNVILITGDGFMKQIEMNEAEAKSGHIRIPVHPRTALMLALREGNPSKQLIVDYHFRLVCKRGDIYVYAEEI